MSPPATALPNGVRMANPFRHFNSSPEVIRLMAMMYVRYPLSLRNVENLLFERGARRAAFDQCRRNADTSAMSSTTYS